MLGTASRSHWLLVINQSRPWKSKISDSLSLTPEQEGWIEHWRQQKIPFSLLARDHKQPGFALFGWHRGQVACFASPASAPERLASPLLLVCTHGSRDRCCGSLGVPLAQGLKGEVWQVSHLGGHRFAPTLWELPSWKVYGRVDCQAWNLGQRHRFLRGHAAYDPRLQVFEGWLEASREEAPRRLFRRNGYIEVHWARHREAWQVEFLRRQFQGPLSCRDGESFQSHTYFRIKAARMMKRGWLVKEEQAEMSSGNLTMTDHDYTLLRTLVALAWADGSLASGELEWIEKVMEQLQVKPEQRQPLLEGPPALPSEDELRLALPDGEDRETFLRFLLSVSLEDGETSVEELDLLKDLAKKLGVSHDNLEEMRQSVLAT
jgi:uncharacterized tellurite resistance protein B-like protein